MKVRIPNSGGPGNMNQMLKQAQKMQEDMATLQADLETREYTATAGGGLITATVDGKHLVKSIKLNVETLSEFEDTEIIEDLVTVAINEAINNAIKVAEEEMGAITGGLNLPGMF